MSTVAIGLLRETEIRPDHLMKGQAERFAADIGRLLARHAEFVKVPCPACGSSRAGAEFEKYTLSYVRCSACATVYLSPRPTPAVLEYYYQTSENYRYWNQYIFPASEEARREKIFRPRVDRVLEICRRYAVPTRTLLEIGAGFGTFCEEMRKLKVFERIVAVEPTPDLAQTCRQRGLEVIARPIEQVHWQEGPVNVIASFEVLEHLFSPREFVLQCGRLLSPGGILLLTCPNVKGFDIVVLGAGSSAVDVEHLNYFHPASISQLVSLNGFDVLEVQTPGKLDAELVRKKALAKEFDLSAQPFLEQILLEEWDRVGGGFQTFLAENGLSSHMWLVARKRGEGSDGGR